MKKLLTILLGIALILPLYSQEYDDDDYDDDYDYEYDDETGYETTAGEEAAPIEIAPKEAAPKEAAPKEAPHPVREKKPPKEEPAPEPEKKNHLARQYFEIGIDAGVGFDNGLVGLNDILKKNIEIDLKKIAQSIPENGSGLNFDLATDFFMNIKNIHIGKGLWDFGFIVDVDGGINMNIPKSLFTLISDGNINPPHASSGTISASGSIFTEIGLKSSSKYRVGRRNLYVGIKPAIFTPVVYIPSHTGISYSLKTEKEEDNGTTKEGLFLDTEGAISVYTPTSLERINFGRLIFGANGFDLSLGAEYAFSPYLDIGGNLSNIPIAAAVLTNEMRLRLEDKDTGDDFGFELSGTVKAPNLGFTPDYIYNVKKEVRRPMRFDLYAHYRPFKSDFLEIKPNLGFTVNINKEDEKWYFNGGLEARLSLINFLIIYLGSGYKEEIWRQRVGFAVNLRVFELGLEAMLRDQTFDGCFKGRGFGFNLGLRFGW